MATEQTTNERGAETGRDGGLQAARQNRHGMYSLPTCRLRRRRPSYLRAWSNSAFSINLKKCKYKNSGNRICINI